MSVLVPAPVELLEAIGHWRFPPTADRRLQDLMDRNTEGQLTPAEHDELAGLVELSETMALFRAKALRVLDRTP